MYAEGNIMEAEEQSVNPSISSVPMSSKNQTEVSVTRSVSANLCPIWGENKRVIFSSLYSSGA